MGQQQLLIIVLGVIIVGIAIMIGIQLFAAHSVDQKRELLIAECVNLASMAQKYYRIPKEFGGGGRDFTKWEINDLLKVSANGEFTFDVKSEPDEITILAEGNIDVAGEGAVAVKIKIWPDDFLVSIEK